MDRFKTHNLDSLIHGTNAPGLSAYNPCERRMAPLSRDLVGVILPHDTYGSHLNSQGKTVDNELEKQNFEKAAKALCEIWSQNKMDGKQVVCHPVPPGTLWDTPPEADASWCERHVRQSKYFLQIVKCENQDCCLPFRTNWIEVFPSRYLPCPAVVEYKSTGMVPIHPNELGVNHSFLPLTKRLVVKDEKIKKPNDKCTEVPFDTYCPSPLIYCDVPCP